MIHSREAPVYHFLCGARKSVATKAEAPHPTAPGPVASPARPLLAAVLQRRDRFHDGDDVVGVFPVGLRRPGLEERIVGLAVDAERDDRQSAGRALVFSREVALEELHAVVSLELN